MGPVNDQLKIFEDALDCQSTFHILIGEATDGPQVNPPVVCFHFLLLP